MADSANGGIYGGWPVQDGFGAGATEHGYTRFIAQKFVDTLYMKTMQVESDLERLMAREEIDGNPMLIDSLKPLPAVTPSATLTAEGLTKNRDRFAELTDSVIPTEQRQMLPAFYDYMFYVDPRDQAAMNRKLDPTGQFLTSVVGAFSINKDKTIITALDTGVTVHDGKNDQQGGNSHDFATDGGTTLSVETGGGFFDKTSGQEIMNTPLSAAAASDTVIGLGLTVKKLIEARKQLHLNNAMYSGQRPILLIHPTQLHQLLTFAEQVTNADYNAVKPLVSGEISQFLGMDVVTSNHVTAATSLGGNIAGGPGSGGTEDEVVADGHYAYVFMPDALYYGCSGLDTKTDILPERGHTMQIASYMHCGAVRLDGKKVVRIECSDTDSATVVDG